MRAIWSPPNQSVLLRDLHRQGARAERQRVRVVHCRAFANLKRVLSRHEAIARIDDQLEGQWEEQRPIHRRCFGNPLRTIVSVALLRLDCERPGTDHGGAVGRLDQMQTSAVNGSSSGIDDPIDLFQWNEIGMVVAFAAPGSGHPLSPDDHDLIGFNRDLFCSLFSCEA